MSCPWCEYKNMCTYETERFCPKWRRDMMEVVYILIGFYMMAKEGNDES